MTAFVPGPTQETVSTVKLTRMGSAVVDIYPIDKFLIATKRSNNIDRIIVVNDVPYDFSSAQFLVDLPVPPPVV